MVNQGTRRILESTAWDITIGSGMAEEWAELGHEPDHAVRRTVSGVLGRDPSHEEWDYFCREWRDCLQRAAQL
jgi:hypothetical protein